MVEAGWEGGRGHHEGTKIGRKLFTEIGRKLFTEAVPVVILLRKMSAARKTTTPKCIKSSENVATKELR